MKLILIIMAISFSLLLAGQPHTISFQGVLTNSDETVVADTTYTMMFTLYDATIAGNKLWTESQMVATKGGLYHVSLGSVVSLDTLLFDKTYYVQIAVNNTVLPLRTKLVTVPYAVTSNRSDISIRSVHSDTAQFAHTAVVAESTTASINALLDTVPVLRGEINGVASALVDSTFSLKNELADLKEQVLVLSNETQKNTDGNVYHLSGLDSLYLLYDLVEMGYDNDIVHPHPYLYLIFTCLENVTTATIQVMGAYHSDYYYGQGVTLYRTENTQINVTSSFKTYYSGSKIFLKVYNNLNAGNKNLIIYSSLPINPKTVTEIPNGAKEFKLLNSQN